MVLSDNVLHKILNTHKGFLTEKNTLEIPLCLYLCTRSIALAFSLTILGQKEQRGIIKLVAVVNMVPNFLITEKSIMGERSSVPSQVSKCSTTSAFSSKILVQKGQGKLGWFKDKSEVSEPNSPFSLLRCNWLDKNVVNEQNFSIKSMTNLTHLFQEKK